MIALENLAPTSEAIEVQQKTSSVRIEKEKCERAGPVNLGFDGVGGRIGAMGIKTTHCQ